MAKTKTKEALNEANALIARGATSRDRATHLINESQDLLAKVLDKKVGITHVTISCDLCV